MTSLHKLFVGAALLLTVVVCACAVAATGLGRLGFLSAAPASAAPNAQCSVLENGPNQLGNAGFESAIAYGTGPVSYGNWIATNSTVMPRVTTPVHSGTWAASSVTAANGVGSIGYQDIAALQANQGYVLSFWVYITTAKQQVELVYGWDRGPGRVGARGTWMELSSTALLLGAWDGTTLQFPGLSGNQWHNVRLVADSAHLRQCVFVDGTLQGSVTATALPTSGLATLIFGHTSGFSPVATRLTYDDFDLRLAQTSSSYAAAVLSDHPLAYWRLGEESGMTTAIDATGNGQNGTHTLDALGTGGAIADDLDTAASFDGFSSFVRTPLVRSTSGLTQFSYEAWVTVPAVQPLQKLIIGSSYEGALAIEGGTGRLVASICLTYGTDQCTLFSPNAASTDSIADGAWHHVVGTWNGSLLRVYVDGSLAGTSPPTGPATGTSPHPIDIGGFHDNFCCSAGAQRITGTIDEAAYYAQALTPERILAHYQAGKGAGGSTQPPDPLADNYTLLDVAPVGVIDNQTRYPTENAVAINASGSIAGTTDAPLRHAFVHDGTLHDLGSLAGGSGLSMGYGINSFGRVVGMTAIPKSTDLHPFRYDGAMKDLGAKSPGRSFATDINTSNLVVGATAVSKTAQHAFRYDTSLHDMGVLKGMNQSEARAVNDAGVIVGRSWSTTQNRAFRYAASKMADIGTLGGFMSEANDINAGGTIVGTAQTSTGKWHAFLWDGLMHDLTPFSDFATALGINNRGEVVGQDHGHAFLYSDGRLIDLNSQVSSAPGWTFASAHDINDSGQVVGVGIHGGQPRVFRLTQTLLARYAPEMRFAFDETYRPSGAGLATDTYFTDPAHTVKLERHDGFGNTMVLASADPAGPGDQLSLSYLAADVFENDFIDEPEQSAAQDYVKMLQVHPGIYDDRLYARVAPGPPGSGESILQYWFYYYYNPKTFAPGVGHHESDWEWVQMRVDAAGTLKSAAYSQHGSGEKCLPSNVPLTSAGHPIVWPAIGSHANYFWAGDHTVDGPGPLTGTDSTAPNDPNQYTSVLPRQIDVSAEPKWIMWHGFWGASTGTGDSPKSPGWQPAWDALDWDDNAGSCTTPPPSAPAKAPMSERRMLRHAQPTVDPPLPKFTARLSGKYAIVKYCFARFPSNPHRKPWQINVGVDNRGDQLPSLTLGYTIKHLCGTVRHPVGVLKPPYTLYLSVTSQRGERTRLVIRPLR